MTLLGEDHANAVLPFIVDASIHPRVKGHGLQGCNKHQISFGSQQMRGESDHMSWGLRNVLRGRM
jgi:hypothetical protein